MRGGASADNRLPPPSSVKTVRGKLTQNVSPAAAFAGGRGFHGSQTQFLPGVDCRRSISDAPRLSADDPTMVSDCTQSAGHGLSGGAHAYPGTYARRGSIAWWSLKGLSGGVMLRSFCPLRPSSYEALIANACSVSQATFGWRGHRKTAGFADAPETAPKGRRRQPLTSRLPKNVIVRRLRAGKSSALGSPLWIDETGIGEMLFPQRFVRSMFGLCSFRLPARAKGG
ncbi:hypothetical protein MPLB_180041 [Mesorhizobium sp. ORS 3324]|nr:hypothetical protein MPLB_180041 [Mesorhizobium sp. ORS 3324]